mgnify:CR=1 FL=1
MSIGMEPMSGGTGRKSAGDGRSAGISGGIGIGIDIGIDIMEDMPPPCMLPPASAGIGMGIGIIDSGP